MERISFYICVVLFSTCISKIQSELTDRLPIKCSQSELSCGGKICYDSSTQNCTTRKVLQCINQCGYDCYDSTTQKCLNGKICGINEQLCTVKSSFSEYWYNRCYNPLYEACLNHSVCDHPSRSCNNQCMTIDQICVDNTTVCEGNYGYIFESKRNRIKSCNGRCYDTAIEQCLAGSVQCITGNCSGKCYNSSSQQCLNGTICPINAHLCTVKYSVLGTQYNPPIDQCYNPLKVLCVNNTISPRLNRSCNQQYLRLNQVCVDNTTICDVAQLFIDYKPDQIKLCNGTCYDSEVRQCLAGSVQCISGYCSGKCYNSSSQQCLNGTLCKINERLCSHSVLNTKRCYDPVNQTCLDGIVYHYPSRLCNQTYLQNNQICLNNATICNVVGTYNNYQANQLELCNGVCYNSTTQRCVDEYEVRCIQEPYREKCRASSGEHEAPFVLFISILMVICAFVNSSY